MSLVDDVRRMDAPVDQGGTRCFCGPAAWLGDEPHVDDCALNILKRKIVAALEAAEAYIRAGKTDHWFTAALAFGFIDVRETDGAKEYVIKMDSGTGEKVTG